MILTRRKDAAARAPARPEGRLVNTSIMSKRAIVDVEMAMTRAYKNQIMGLGESPISTAADIRVMIESWDPEGNAQRCTHCHSRPG